MNTYFAKDSDLNSKWRIIDADGLVLGRVAGLAAEILMGKGNILFSRNLIMGDEVIIINAAKVKITGKKMDQKVYYHHTGYPGGMKAKSLKETMATKPEDALMSAVKGMLPKNKLGRAMLTRIRIYSGAKHPHAAQQPEPVNVNQAAS